MSNLLLKSRKEHTLVNHVTPEIANWEYVGFSSYILKTGEKLSINSKNKELCLVLIAGKANITANDQTYNEIGQRMSPFEKIPPYAIYTPEQTNIEVTAITDLELGVCSAPSKQGKLPIRLIKPTDIGIEYRGVGNNKRLVHNILPETEDADALLVVEVFTDEGCTSSFPSHKHDEKDSINETYLEESYYHRIDPPQGFAFQRVYTSDGSLDESMAVYDKDIVLVPKGYHPLATIAGYNNYYLNVMAGPIRAWKFSWEQDHQWVNSEEYANKHK